MEKLLEIFAYFLLTIFGLIIPIFAILLALFNDGFVQLSKQYENEKIQTEKKLKDQLKKTTEDDNLDIKDIQQTIKELELVKKTADSKLSLLAPKKTILRLLIPVLLALLFLTPGFIIQSIYTTVLLGLSLISVGFLFYQFWKLLDILIEVKALVDIEVKNEQGRVPELLALIAGNTKKTFLIERVFLKFNNVLLDKDKNTVNLEVDKKTAVPIRLTNLESIMAKNVEAGLRFPIEFLIEKTTGYTIYANGDEQIVRYSFDRIQGDTDLILTPLILTALKKGDFNMKIFIKGENIENKIRDLNIKVH